MELEHIVPCICKILFDNNTLQMHIKDQWLKKDSLKNKYVYMNIYIFMYMYMWWSELLLYIS